MRTGADEAKANMGAEDGNKKSCLYFVMQYFRPKLSRQLEYTVHHIRA